MPKFNLNPSFIQDFEPEPEYVQTINIRQFTDFVLYRHYNMAGDLLYVGQTIDPVERARGHRARSSWWYEVMDGGSTTYQRFSSRDELLNAERSAIRNERPLYNSVHAS